MNEKRVNIQAAKDLGTNLADYSNLDREIKKWQAKEVFSLTPGMAMSPLIQ